MINSIYSANPFLRHLLEGLSPTPTSWIAAHVHREFNMDADRLSHPAEAETVKAEARLCDLTVVDLEPDFGPLRAAIAAGTRAVHEGGRRKRRRKRDR